MTFVNMRAQEVILHKGSMTQISSVSEQGENGEPMWQGLLSSPHQELALIVGLWTSNFKSLEVLCFLPATAVEHGVLFKVWLGWGQHTGKWRGEVILLAMQSHAALCEDHCRRAGRPPLSESSTETFPETLDGLSHSSTFSHSSQIFCFPNYTWLKEIRKREREKCVRKKRWQWMVKGTGSVRREGG